jgi:pimeloyl-ACP methyl ester carboxylesterase
MLAVLGLALVLAAPAPADSQASDTFEILVAGRSLGEETVTRETGADGVVLKSTVALTSPRGRLEFHQILRLGANGRDPLDYALEVAIPGATQELRAKRTATGWTIEAGPANAPTLKNDHPVQGLNFLLDNNLASHLDLISRSATLSPGASTPASFVVPQAAAVITGTIARLEDVADLRRLVVEMAGVRIEIDARASDGAMVEARVPLQHAIYRRKDAPPRAPEDAPVADAREREVVLSTPEGDLAATLTIPKGAGPFPAVVFLSGSGPNDRNESIGPNAPLRDLARALADREIASYRFDKATTSASVMAKRPVTLRAEYDDDAARAIEALRGAAGVDPARVFVLGHSLGAVVAPRIAGEAGPKVAGAILLAASGRPLDALVVEQVRQQAKLAGQDVDTVVAPIVAKLKEIRDGGGSEPFLGAPPSYWREAMALDVSADLRKLGKPALVLQGDNDVQVNVERDFGLIRKTVGEQGGRVTYRTFAGLNHLFMKYDGTSTGAEYGARGMVDLQVAEAIASWIRGLSSPAKDAPRPGGTK